jgi:3-carboxy-cis,cis-muconate cycloisomerase
MLASMVQEHERGLGGWHAEWETLPEICMLAGGAVAQAAAVLGGLEIREDRMSENIEVTRGLIFSEAVAMALRSKLGRSQSHQLLEEASRRAVEKNQSLQDVLLSDARVREHLSTEEIARLMDPGNYIGSAREMTRKVLSSLDRKL